MRAIIQTDGGSGHLGILVQQLVFHDHLGNKHPQPSVSSVSWLCKAESITGNGYYHTISMIEVAH